MLLLLRAAKLVEVYYLDMEVPPLVANVAATGVASRAALGSPAAQTTVGVVAQGVASSAALGQPAVGSVANVAASGLGSQAALGSPSAATTVGISASGVGSASGFGAPTVTSTMRLVEVYYLDMEVPLAITAEIAATGVASRAGLGTPVVQSALFVAASGVEARSALGTPAASSEFTVQATGLESRAALGSPSVDSANAVSIAATGVASAAALGAPVASSQCTIEPAGVASAAAFGSPLVTTGDVPLTVVALGVMPRHSVSRMFVTDDGIRRDLGPGGPDADDDEEAPGPHQVPRRARYELVPAPAIASAAPAVVAPPLEHAPETIDTGELLALRGDVAAITEQAREAAAAAQARAFRDRMLRLVLLVDALDD